MSGTTQQAAAALSPGAALAATAARIAGLGPGTLAAGAALAASVTRLPRPLFYAYAAPDTGVVTGWGHLAPQDPVGIAGRSGGKPAVAITEAQYWSLLAAPAGKVATLLDGALSFADPPAPALAGVQAAASAAVDAQAEAARLGFLTGGSGQALEYQQTNDEAARAAADPSPDPASYPFLQAELQAQQSAGIGVTFAQVIAQVQAQVAGWNQAGSAIKEIRRGAKLRIDAATTAEAVAAVLAGLAWPTPS